MSKVHAPDREAPGRAVWVVIGAVGLGFVLRVAWAVFATRQPQGVNDPVLYILLAERFADGQGYVSSTGAPTAYYPPGYPVALGVLFWAAGLIGIDGSRIGLTAGLNVVLGTVTVALLAVLASRLFGWRVAAIVGVLAACFPTLIGYSSVGLSEPLFVFLMVLSLTLALWSPLDASPPHWVRIGGASVVLGLALLVRPVGGLLVLALLVGIAMAGGRRRSLALGALVVGLVAIVLLPWAVRNATVLDAGLTLSTNTGDNLCIGNNPDAGGTFALPGYCFDDLPDQDAAADVAEVARAETTQERALQWIRANPLAQPGLIVLRTAATFQHGHEFRWAAQSYGSDLWLDDRSIVLIDWVSDVGWFGIIAIGLCGLPILWDRRDPRRVVVLLGIIGLSIASWPFFGNPRFGVPAVALMVIPAALVLSGLPALWRVVRGDDSTESTRRAVSQEGPDGVEVVAGPVVDPTGAVGSRSAASSS